MIISCKTPTTSDIIILNKAWSATFGLIICMLTPSFWMCRSNWHPLFCVCLLGTWGACLSTLNLRYFLFSPFPSNYLIPISYTLFSRIWAPSTDWILSLLSARFFSSVSLYLVACFLFRTVFRRNILIKKSTVNPMIILSLSLSRLLPIVQYSQVADICIRCHL